jgi:hypothetical protein
MGKVKKLFSLDYELSEKIEAYAADNNMTLSEVADTAFTLLFNDPGGNLISPEISAQLIGEKLDKIKKELYYVDHNVQVTLIMLDFFFRHYEDKNGNIGASEDMSDLMRTADKFVKLDKDANMKNRNRSKL